MPSTSEHTPDNSTPVAHPPETSQKRGKVNVSKSTSKRHRGMRVNSDLLLGITNPAICRLARRAGIKRISKTVFPEARRILNDHINTIVRDSVIYTLHSKKKTILSLSTALALKKNGRPLYGFEH
jgi:histone H4